MNFAGLRRLQAKDSSEEGMVLAKRNTSEIKVLGSAPETTNNHTHVAKESPNMSHETH